MTAADDDPRPPAHDLRLPILGLAAWAAALVAHLVSPAVSLGGAAVLCGAALVVRRSRVRALAGLVLAAALVGAAVAGSVAARQSLVSDGPLRTAAEQRAAVDLTATVVADPRSFEGPFGERVAVRVVVHTATVRGASYDLRVTALVLGEAAWGEVRLGERLRLTGRAAVADDPGLAALVVNPSEPQRVRGPDPWWRAAEAVRASLRASVADRPPAQRALVPSLVVGDDAELPAEVEADFRTTGLTHLTAVSGTNLTLVVGFVLLLARAVGVRGRWLHVVGLLGIAGFVLVARTEPSVVRAAAMGAVGLFALGTDGRRRGLRALGAAVVGLLLVWPALALSVGFALSALATAGIVLLGPPVQAALARWLPAPVAAAIAVPLAAQVACTPIVAALSAEVSLVAVAANLLVAPAVGPATVLGLGGGLVGLVAPPLARVLGTLAAWCVAWIAAVAERGADLPTPALGWSEGPLAIAALTALCAATAAGLPRLLARPPRALVGVVVLLLVVLGLPGRLPGLAGSWPPTGWVLVACDVGQGDALALAVGPGSALVVDAGPDPALVDGCLDRLGVRSVPLLLLTHFHADHVRGVSGVLRGRTVGAIETSAMLDPPEAVTEVQAEATRAGVPVGLAPYGVTRRFGDATVQVLWPDLPGPVPGAGDGSRANDASVVVVVESAGLRLLLTGDVEPPGQQRLAAALPGLDVDVLKVPHHGSPHQDLDWLRSLSPTVAVVCVGDNDYGHPDPRLVDALTAAGAAVARTDEDGDVAVVVDDGQPRAVPSG